MYDLRNPYQREHDSFQARGQLSIAQIIAMQGVDAETAALIWLILEHGASLTVAGPTEPRPGAGKSTVLQALLQFLPEGASLAYTSGMSETFSFTRLPDINPAATYAFCNEVSDHQHTYMWGSIARRYLLLPSRGYHIVTCTHADTIDDVLHLYQHDLRLRIEDIRRLGLVVNIGLSGHGKSTRRRWLTVYFLQPKATPLDPEALQKLPLSIWNERNDTFEHADSSILQQLADWAGLPPLDFTISLKQRTAFLKELSQGKGVDMDQMYEALRGSRRLNRPTMVDCAKKSS